MSEPGYDADLPAHVNSALTDFLRRAGESIGSIEPTFGPATDALSDFVLGGGKRLRPTFAWWSWRGAGGDPEGEHAEGVLRAVASLELIQACALIHDDVLDSSDSRRGSPTVHVAFAARHAERGWLGSPDSFGLAAAVLIGDLALAWADDMFSEAPLPPEVLAAARPAWRAMRTEVLAGQYLDVHTQATGDASVEAALRIDRLKTAAYTVQRPLHLGAALAGAGPELIDPLTTFGRDLGVAFQLRDDMLGVFGDPSVTGKPAGDDLREGKRTLLLALGLRFAAEQEREQEHKVITAAVGNPGLTLADVDTVRQALTDVGAVAEVERRIDELTEAAHATLRGIDLAEPATTKLTELTIVATQRKY
ncbi:polyprenyl synthetase family protein [Prauserella cavernicola]|uniref:Polyprenyl synthetase family protein n=1 Tax=Prauserella cavernicola TaxID=2800127 RepID=A0A934V6F5_9PSEU|nr:polyprenyl synthetase family protein [Prauserella cavernicola]MBK1786145.1 polyprenyl synthetase family protein [Prauserella cavernicola]